MLNASSKWYVIKEKIFVYWLRIIIKKWITSATKKIIKYIWVVKIYETWLKIVNNDYKRGSVFVSKSFNRILIEMATNRNLIFYAI